MKNIYMFDLSHQYYVDIAKSLIVQGHRIPVIGTSRLPEYWPDSLSEYLAVTGAKVTFWEDFNIPERFERVFDPDYSVLNLAVFSRLATYEKLFLLSTDRLAFFPISQLERCRLFYRVIAHFYKILKTHSIDAVVFFGTPHGPWSIALFGLAKALNLTAMYVDWVGLAPSLSTIETDLEIRREYSSVQSDLGLLANKDELKRIQEIVERSVHAPLVWTTTKHMNRTRTYLRAIGSLLLRDPLGEYVAPDFFLNRGKRRRIGYVVPLMRYFAEARKAMRFYNENATSELPDENSVALFLHLQPEASTMPLGGIFADQLLAFDMLMAALPEGMTVWVKEHPFMFEMLGQDRHERSVAFYVHMLKDPRVRLISTSVRSDVLISMTKVVVSVAGSATWEAIRAGKPGIVFGWAWFSACRSCFSADSVDSLRSAFRGAFRKSREEVTADLESFISGFERRLIYGAGCRPALAYLDEGYDCVKAVANISRAIGITVGAAVTPGWKPLSVAVHE